jgi:hypothetical protein
MNDLMKIFILPVTLFMGLQTFFHLLSPNFFFSIAARLAVQNGAAGIIVSNHGARQLDYVPSTIIALEEVHVLLMIMTYFWCILAISRKFTGFLSCQPVNFPFHQVQETFAM